MHPVAATKGVQVTGPVERRRRGQRVRVALAIGASYAVDVACLVLFWRAGVVDGRIPALYAAAAALHVVLVTALQLSGLTRRWRQPHLAAPQAVYAIALQLAGMAMAPQLRAYFLGVLFIVFAFAMLRLRLRSALALWALSCVAVAVLAMRVPALVALPSLGVRPHALASALIAVAFALVLLRLILLNRYGAYLRSEASRRAAIARMQAEQAEARATHDGLTGALNRAAMLPRIAEQLDLIARGRTCAALAMIDIDHFKHINDRHGHLLGDEVLRRLVDVIHGGIRGTDKLARYGGEEFLLLMPATSIAEARVFAERLREAAASLDTTALAPGLEVRVSIGLTMLVQAERVDEAIGRADRALYRAKEQGRNRVVAVEVDPEELILV